MVSEGAPECNEMLCEENDEAQSEGAARRPWAAVSRTLSRPALWHTFPASAFSHPSTSTTRSTLPRSQARPSITPPSSPTAAVKPFVLCK
ncbi:hypothetical protein KCU61_g486, partial [Aureobasidium melanogenum]